MENLENKTPEELEQDKHEIFTELRDSLKSRFHCSEVEATNYLISRKEEIGDIYNKELVEEYLNKPEAEKDFEDFRINFGKFHETPEN
jgi:hypothetical protein